MWGDGASTHCSYGETMKRRAFSSWRRRPRCCVLVAAESTVIASKVKDTHTAAAQSQVIFCMPNFVLTDNCSAGAGTDGVSI